MSFSAKHTILSVAAVLLTAAPVVRAVYAPIPELEQGRALTAYLGAGVYYDTNIFGAANNAISSYVYEVDPSLVFNASIEGKTFVSASYRLTHDYVPDRPGKTSFDSHLLTARFAHTFTPQMELELSDLYEISKNPASLLPGLSTVLNTDQSYRRNQADLRYAAGLTKRTGATFKARATRFDYEAEQLGRSLDRDEYLGALTLNHALLPELQAIGEYRHLIIDYAENGSLKNKRSDFVLAGADYALNSQFSLSARLGAEHRRREGDRSATLPYAELGAKFDYGRDSYVSLGYGYSVEETSNVELYTDISVNRFFVNLQQRLASKLLGTVSTTWQPSRLHGRAGVHADENETNWQTGFALTYQPTKRWSVSAVVDFDRISSGDASRNLDRSRTGLNARYVF